MRPQFDAIAFDLLTALIDSWSLWIAVAGNAEKGRAWRQASLARVTTAGAYRPYEAIVREAAADADIADLKADELLDRWSELRPWPDSDETLKRLKGLRLAVVTNCSQRLAEAAARATTGEFEIIMSAERAGYYKTSPQAYLAALTALGLPPDRVLFVAGSAHDVPGAGAVGMPVYWANRNGSTIPSGAPRPIVISADLNELPRLVCK
jgi:2-haloalkanoic acid dehalogenase type II